MSEQDDDARRDESEPRHRGAEHSATMAPRYMAMPQLNASLPDAGLQQLSEGRLRLAEARGTLWSGAGQIEMLGRTGYVELVASPDAHPGYFSIEKLTVATPQQGKGSSARPCGRARGSGR